MKRTIALSTLLFALNASADSPASIPTRIPTIPDGSYNELLDRAIAAADAYDQELQVYKQQDDMLARN